MVADITPPDLADTADLSKMSNSKLRNIVREYAKGNEQLAMLANNAITVLGSIKLTCDAQVAKMEHIPVMFPREKLVMKMLQGFSTSAGNADKWVTNPVVPGPDTAPK